jgi:Na+/proline symporter
MSGQNPLNFVLYVIIVALALLLGIVVMDALVTYAPQSPSDPLYSPQQNIIQAFSNFAPLLIPGAIGALVIVIAKLKQ